MCTVRRISSMIYNYKTYGIARTNTIPCAVLPRNMWQFPDRETALKAQQEEERAQQEWEEQVAAAKADSSLPMPPKRVPMITCPPVDPAKILETTEDDCRINIDDPEQCIYYLF